MYKLITAAGVAATLLAAGAMAQDAGTGSGSDAAAAYDASTVLATVNGTDITLGHAIVMRSRLPEQYQSIPDNVLLPGIVEQLVDQTLLAALASPSPDDDPLEVKLQLDNERRGTLAARAVQSEIDVTLDDAAVQAGYDEAFADFEPQPEYNASHILVEQEAKAQELAAEIEGGADFAELAGANSSDPGSAANGGSLGWFGAGQMVPEFDAAVAELDVGEVSEPIKSQFGWHIIKLDEMRESAPPPLEEVRGDIEERLRQEAVQARIAELREEADVELMEPGIPPAAIRESDLLQN